MKRIYRYIAVMAVAAAVSLVAATGAAAQNVSARIMALLDSSSVKHSDTGVMIYNITKDKPVFGYKADNLYRPASIQKLLCVITALNDIAPEKQIFTTSLYYTGSISGGVLKGDLYVKGGYDPEFTVKNLDDLAASVARAGIKKVEGHVYGDVTMTDNMFWGEGWCWDDCQSSFQPYMSPLIVNKGCVSVSVRPTGNGGYTVSGYPDADAYKIEKRGGNGYPEISSDWMNRSNTIVVSGRFKKAASKQVCIYPAEELFMSAFMKSLKKSGVTAGETGYKAVPDGASELYSIDRPLTEAVHEAMKESDNLSAEAILFKIAELDRKSYASREDGTRRIGKLVTKLGLDARDYRIMDGCGLSIYDYVSPRLMVTFLDYAYTTPRIKSRLYNQLPVAGVDGTLKNRMKGTKAMRNVHAKTGSVTGVSSLAGYVTAANGDVLAFAIISQGVFPSSSGRKLQDKICVMLSEAGDADLK